MKIINCEERTTRELLIDAIMGNDRKFIDDSLFVF